MDRGETGRSVKSVISVHREGGRPVVDIEQHGVKGAPTSGDDVGHVAFHEVNPRILQRPSCEFTEGFAIPSHDGGEDLRHNDLVRRWAVVEHGAQGVAHTEPAHEHPWAPHVVEVRKRDPGKRLL